MEQITKNLLDLLEANRNDIKLSLKNYIDYTVDSKFDHLKKEIVTLAGKSNRLSGGISSGRASKRSSAQSNLELAVNSDSPSEASVDDMAGPSTSAGSQHTLVNGESNETEAALDPDCIEAADKKPSAVAPSLKKAKKKKALKKKSPKSIRGAVKAGVSTVDPSAESTAPRASQRKRIPKKVGFDSPFRAQKSELSFDLSNAAKMIARKSQAKRKVAEPNESVKKVKREIGDNKPVANNNNPKPYQCTWENCTQSYNHRGDAVRHVRVQHFHLPKTMNEQVQKNIVDSRDPSDHIQLVALG